MKSVHHLLTLLGLELNIRMYLLKTESTGKESSFLDISQQLDSKVERILKKALIPLVSHGRVFQLIRSH